MRTTRRAFLRGSVATASAALLAAPGLGQAKARVVVLGGGFAGATCARELQRADPRLAVTLVEENAIYTAARSATRSSPVCVISRRSVSAMTRCAT
jgi:sulfide dehydrogenase [flavocytochrome c] flavoprotein subunit